MGVIIVKTIKQADKNRQLTLKEKYEKIKQLQLEGRCKTEICRSLNMDIWAYNEHIWRKSKAKNGTCNWGAEVKENWFE